ncbi:26157_t:CDS:2 [Gigaspora margarita]|uniref:26157_t:CDS:1 n=1 Tax=Gigaspora margarita TaxID=4874 RepID=A0ABN7UIH2_GIGMA|nr:26157_t:CDS:2 [Gigaspora margarita]
MKLALGIALPVGLKMIPRQSRQISFCEEFDRTLEKVPTPGRLILIINNILVTITLLFFLIDDNEGRDECEGCNVGCGFALNIPGAILSIPIAYPYLKDQIIGPDYRIIQCDQIDSLGSWQDQWCAHHQRRIILSWLLIFVWFTTFFIYLAITLLIVLVVLCKRAYRISKLWIVYQYQYRKGLFLTWLKEQKDKSRQQQIDPVSAENVKSDLVNKEINIVEVVTIG